MDKARRKPERLSSSLKVDRLPPHANEAEQAVLGSCLIEPAAIAQCVSFLKAGAECFYDLRHRTIYETFVALTEGNHPITVVSLGQSLKDKQQLDAVGGYAFLGALEEVAVPAALDYYLTIVRDKFVLRRAVQVATELVAKIYEHTGPAEDLIDEWEKDALSIGQHLEVASDWTIKASVHGAIQEIEQLHDRKGLLNGLPTGLVDLDKITGGLQPGEMIVLAARPSMGKSALMGNIAEHLGIDCKIPVGIFSLEMKQRALVMRLLCARARVNLVNVREGFLADRDFPKLTSAAGKLIVAPIYIDDSSGLSILQLRARARRMQQLYGVKLIAIDYLQLLLASAGRRYSNRQEEISAISAGVKALAQELNVPVLVLSQLNRELDREKNRKPRLSDLRESGSIEQDADVVGMLYRPSQSEDTEGDKDAIPVNLAINKQRNGPTGDINLTFLKCYTRFESAAKLSNDDPPAQQHFYPD